MHIDFGNVRQFVGIVHPIITPPHHLACGLRSDFRSLRNSLGAARLTAWPSLVDHDTEHVVLVEQGLRPALILQHYQMAERGTPLGAGALLLGACLAALMLTPSRQCALPQVPNVRLMRLSEEMVRWTARREQPSSSGSPLTAPVPHLRQLLSPMWLA